MRKRPIADLKSSSFMVAGLTAFSVPMVAISAPAAPLDRVNISVGGYFSKIDSEASINGLGNRFQTAPFELTDGTHAVGRVRLGLMLGDKQGLEFDFYRFQPNNSRSVDQSYRVGGTDYTLNATVSGRARFDLGSVSYRWWFGEGQTALGIGLGAAYYGVRFDVNGNASLAGSSSSSGDSFSENTVAPLVTAGVRQSVNGRTRLYFNGSAVRKNGGSLNGHIYNASIGFEWFVFENLGIGAEYGYSRIALNKDNSEFAANLTFNLQGPSIFLKARF
jgi:hypothetical protein